MGLYRKGVRLETRFYNQDDVALLEEVFYRKGVSDASSTVFQVMMTNGFNVTVRRCTNSNLSKVCSTFSMLGAIMVKLNWPDEKTEDHNECIVASWMIRSSCFRGEPFLVAKEGSEEEDDGYMVTYVHDENVGESQFLVMDAKSPNLDVVAAVKLPCRVPYGFHGLFVKESDLFNNKP